MTEGLSDILPDEGSMMQVGATCLQLCQASYAVHPERIPCWVEKVQPFVAGNVWHCEKGGWQSDPDNINLAFVASYGPPAGPPLAYALVIRGTDTDGPDPWSIVNQVYQDVFVVERAPIPWSTDPSDGYIASGTANAYGKISKFNFDFPGGHLQSYLTEVIRGATRATGKQPFLFVIGHSLGGCMASVFGPDMGVTLERAGLQKKVISVTYAAPTAGDQVFVDQAGPLCALNYRYRNSLDIVPRAWADLADMPFLYLMDIEMDMSDLLVLETTRLAVDASWNVYVQPEANKPLTGPIMRFSPPPSNPWRAQAGFQHETATYMGAIGGTNLWDLPGAGPDARSEFGRA